MLKLCFTFSLWYNLFTLCMTAGSQFFPFSVAYCAHERGGGGGGVCLLVASDCNLTDICLLDGAFECTNAAHDAMLWFNKFHCMEVSCFGCEKACKLCFGSWLNAQDKENNEINFN